MNHFLTHTLTSTELVVGAVAVEVVTLAVLAAVALLGVLPLLALTRAAHAVAVVAADVCAVAHAAVSVQILRPHLVSAALTLLPDTAIVTADTHTHTHTHTSELLSNLYRV